MLLLNNILYHLARRSGGGGGGGGGETLPHAVLLIRHYHHRRVPPPLLPRSFLFSTVAANVESKEEDTPSFMVGYLVGSCGFSTDKAIKASKNLTHVKSPHKPDSVLCFFRGEGFDDAQIRNIVSADPRLLCAGVEKTLDPKIRALKDLGFSGSELVQLVAGNPALLNRTNISPSIRFWRNLLGSNEILLKVIKADKFFLFRNIDRVVLPNISLLRECGIPDRRIPAFIQRSGRLVTRGVETLNAHIKRAEELGFSRGSRMFEYGLCAINNLSRSSLDAKLALLGSFGWTEEETLSMVRRAPAVLGYSEMKIRKSMDFLVKEVGCEPSYISLHPILLMLSLEKRLMPRYRVLQILKSKGFPEGKCSFLSIVNMSEGKFVDKFIVQLKDRALELQDVYAAACTTRRIAI